MPVAGEERWDAPEVGVRTLRSVLVYYRRAVKSPSLEEVWARYSLPLTLETLFDTSQFVSYRFLERLLQALTEASGDPDFMEKAGRLVATPDGLGFGYYLLRGVGTVGMAYRTTVDMGPTFNRVGKFTIEKATRTTMTLRYESQVTERTRHACRGRSSQLAALPTIWGLPPASVREECCQVDGASCCRYALSWVERPTRAWRRWVLGAVAAGTAAFFSAALPLQCLVVACAFFAGAWLDLRAGVHDLERQLDEQTAGLSRSLEELQRRAHEIFQSNVALDQRVAERTRALELALERLRQLDSLKSEFFANVSHELRTPLTLILSPLEERLARPIAEADALLLQSVRSSAHRLLRLVDDLLDLSRIDAGHLRLTVSEVDLASLARQLKGLFGQTAAAKGLSLVVDAPGTTDEVWGDLHRLEMVVSNLVNNALKFTPLGGTVTVRVRQTASEASLSVADTGPGIPADARERIFERFYQVDGSLARSQGGVGIGLSLAKNLTELHGGRLELNAEGPGATFTLTLPKGRDHFRPEVVERRTTNVEVPSGRRVDDGPAPSRPVPTLPGEVGPGALPMVTIDGRRPRVLVVEDNEDLASLLKALLEPSCEVLVLTDSTQALALAQRERPDLVLSDVMMPQLTGFDLCRALKADPALSTCPVMLLTARAGPEAALDGYAAGADEFVEKPFHPRVLLARVHAQLRLRALGLKVASQARLAAVGTLAAGVGHEVRNPVNAVLNGVRVLQRQVPGGDQRRLLDVIADGATRIERISKALLLHVSPGDGGGTRPVKVREGLDSTLALLEHRLGDVAVHNEVPADLAVVASAPELNQVFLNLLDNSLRAGSRHIWLRSAVGGGTLAISVADDGKGVPREIERRLFDPFFTTRPPGEGTGLGLSLSRQVLRRWGGELSYSSRPSGGAVFTVTLNAEGIV